MSSSPSRAISLARKPNERPAAASRGPAAPSASCAHQARRSGARAHQNRDAAAQPTTAATAPSGPPPPTDHRAHPRREGTAETTAARSSHPGAWTGGNGQSLRTRTAQHRRPTGARGRLKHPRTPSPRTLERRAHSSASPPGTPLAPDANDRRTPPAPRPSLINPQQPSAAPFRDDVPGSVMRSSTARAARHDPSPGQLLHITKGRA